MRTCSRQRRSPAGGSARASGIESQLTIIRGREQQGEVTLILWNRWAAKRAEETRREPSEVP